MRSDAYENRQISREYQNELESIREEVKKGDCTTLKECLMLFEDLWDDHHPSNLLLSNKARKRLENSS